MKTIRHPSELRRLAAETRASGGLVGLVPTMGALHEGHLSLVRAARAETSLVIVSVFVNAKQFGPSEDFGSYPRDEERDIALAETAGADLVYAPAPETMYPPGFSTKVSVSGLTEVLCGSPRARGRQHFDGVTTVVCKLLGAATPDRAYFGQKDAQQVAVIRHLVRDLDLGTEIRVLPIVREPDGLAMSSRNAYLDAAERERAVAISDALQAAEEALRHGESLATALASARAVLAGAGLEPEYLEARDPGTLAEVTETAGRAVLVAVAAQVGPARLIDNFIFDPDPDVSERDKIPAIQGGSRADE